MPSPPGGTVHTEVAAVSDGWTVIWRRRRQASELSERRGRSHPPHGGDWLLRVLPGRGGSGTGGDIRQVADDWAGTEGRVWEPPSLPRQSTGRDHGRTAAVAAEQFAPLRNRTTAQPHKLCYRTKMHHCATAQTALPHQTAQPHDSTKLHYRTLCTSVAAAEPLAAATGAFPSRVAAAASAPTPDPNLDPDPDPDPDDPTRQRACVADPAAPARLSKPAG